MSEKHYKEQKMLIENFRRWQESEEEPEVLQEGIGDIIQYLTISAATLYTIGPYLKIAVHHPSVQKVLMGQDTESSNMFRAMAMGLKGADNAGEWLQDFADNIFGQAKDQEDLSIFKRLSNAVALFIFLVILMTTSFPVLGGMFVRALPRISMFFSKTTKATKKKAREVSARIQGNPTDKEAAEAAAEIEKELEELKALEQEKTAAQEAAASVSEVMSMIKEDPQKAAAEYDVDLSPEELKAMKIDPDAEPIEKPKSRAKKVELPPKKVTPDELAARRASADANRRASDPTGRLRTAYQKNKAK